MIISANCFLPLPWPGSFKIDLFNNFGNSKQKLAKTVPRLVLIDNLFPDILTDVQIL